jgi:hypothetical protein
MRNFTLAVALAALAVALFGVFRAPPAAGAADGLRDYPPLIFASRALLECSISSTQAGRQTLRTVNGQGFDFDMSMVPIKDGLVKLQPPGMRYQFTAFPSNKVPAEFKGLGKGTIIEMKTEVEVEVNRFTQPGGPGTEIRFTAADINGDAAYVEFTGLFVRASDNKRFPFRVLFGSVSAGSGVVLPLGIRPETALLSKMVNLGSLSQPAAVTTAMYEAETDVARLK